MRHTERKSVLGATNLLRNYRECDDRYGGHIPNEVISILFLINIDAPSTTIYVWVYTE